MIRGSYDGTPADVAPAHVVPAPAHSQEAHGAAVPRRASRPAVSRVPNRKRTEASRKPHGGHTFLHGNCNRAAEPLQNKPLKTKILYG